MYPINIWGMITKKDDYIINMLSYTTPKAYKNPTIIILS